MPTIKLSIGLPSRRTFGSICILGALASISGLAYMRWRHENLVRRTEYYQMAIQQVRQHSGAVDLLGMPIRETGFNLSNEKNRCDADQAQLQVFVHGPKDKGTVYFWASNNEQKGWLIDRLELETKLHPNTRFLLKRPNYALVSNESDNESDDEDSEGLSEQSNEYVSEQQKPAPQSKEPLQETLPPLDIHNYPVQQRKQQEDKETIPIVQTTEGGLVE
ncbi:cytochrome c oxidase assembly factor 1 homolog [Drosophila kikkawai]|uniref:Cytochrome c oxidase assembly factor 1 homolog n=1 Tax=Drosophila kikkawai TaxID=30033 RepID=A0A6P4IH59_DROKI|nr:uncharacterized protein LOC108074511 [Drosophila kikkawai]